MVTFKEKKWVIFPLVLVLFGVLCFIYREDLSPAVGQNSTEPYYEGIKGENQASLCLNVDWGEEYIPEILKILKKEDVKITCFLTGRWCEKNPDMAKEILKSGMEIGNHGLKHKSPNAMNYDENLEDIKESEAIFNRVLSVKTMLFAPAAGEIENQVLDAAKDLGYKTILWSVDTIDWQKPTPEVIVERVDSKIADGSIVLMHPTENTVQALPQMIKNIKGQGLNLVPVSELIS
ncbi:MAG: polysaccharide deacetylase family protein [Clostridiales bacterium]